MKRFTYMTILLCCALATRAQQIIPVTIVVPAGSKLILQVYAKGVQAYRCTQDPKNSTHYLWTFQEPKALLFSDSSFSKKIGKHYLSATKSPTWTLTDGSTVSGVKLQQAAAPDGSIPWLLLKAVPQSANGSLTPVTYIQRLFTRGGTAPANADAAQKGKLLEVSYTAEYLFYQ